MIRRVQTLFDGRRRSSGYCRCSQHRIRSRYSCVPIEWYDRPHGWAERNRVYIAGALDLLERTAIRLLDRAGIDKDAIDAVVTVSTTGIATPSLDALLIERMGLRRDVRRLPIFGLGCAGGVLGLARAAGQALAAPGETVLFLVVELCALSFRRDDWSKSNIVATALFGDGAAGALLSTEGDGTGDRRERRAYLARQPRGHGLGHRR